MKKFIVPVLGCIVVLFLAVFIWPTRYRYEQIKGSSNTWPVRIDRLTGKTEALYRNGGWVSSDRVVTSKTAEIQDIPEAEVDLIRGNAKLSGNGFLQMQVYNGSQWKLSELTVNVILLGQESYIEDRPYRIS